MDNKIFCFPGYTRKALSFTIDDGNIPLDKKFLNIVKPAGILGTFNICPPLKNGVTPADYREIYRGYEIANHCKRHPLALDPNAEYKFTDEVYDAETADPAFLYKTDTEGLYLYKYTPRYWSYIATPDAYCKLVEEGKAELEAVFGEGSIKDFVWPYGLQKDPEVLDRIVKMGYRSVRKTVDSTFDLPRDRFNWSYNAHHTNLLEKAEAFESIQDDGELKWFCFGVHSHDFENNNCWDVLENFAERYGNRPEDFWYATVGEIFEYEDAVKAATVTDTEIINNSDITVYAIINGKRVAIFPKYSYKLT